MTPLRLRMIEDIKSAGLAAATQTVYTDAVRRLAAHYRPFAGSAERGGGTALPAWVA
jgi:hypothetical protein